MKEELRAVVEEFLKETNGKWTHNPDNLYDLPTFADFCYWLTQGRMPTNPHDPTL